jgi:phosphoglycerol transferase
LFDETSPRQVPPYEQVARDFRSDANFVAKIESSVPAGSPIFQLPMMRYIISPPFGRFNNYQLLRGYLHSKSLRWSFGAMIGRQADQWQQDNVVDHPLATVVENLKSKGFAGIYLDRRAFPNDNLERALVKMLGNEMVSDDQALVFCRFEKNAHP